MPWLSKEQLEDFNAERKKIWGELDRDPEQFSPILRMHLTLGSKNDMEAGIAEALRAERRIMEGDYELVDFGDE